MRHRTIYRRYGKPGFFSSGFFFLLLMVTLAGRADLRPSEMLTGLLWDSPDLLTRCTAPSGAMPSTKVFISGAYNDLYRSLVTEKSGSREELDKKEAYSLQGNTGLIVERKSWGASASVRTGMIEAHLLGRDRKYAVDARVPLNNLTVTGWAAVDGKAFFKGVSRPDWAGNLRARLVVGLGYDAGLPLDYRGFSNSSLIDSIETVLHDPRFAHYIGGTLSAWNISLTVYETKHPFINASARVERQSNHAFVEIPLAAVTREAGAKAEISAGRNHSVLTGALVNMSSDTAISGENILPAGCAGKGRRYGFSVSLGDVRFAPAAEINLMAHRLKIRGYDYSDTAAYSWLDSNAMLFVNGQASADVPWKLRAGLFGEYLAGTNKKFGRFDPYIVSSFTIFDPKKYRIDTVDIRYHAVGFFLERSFGVFRRDSAGAAIAMSYIRTRGFLNTREYDFTNIFPKLINPQTYGLVDEELLLFAPEVRYTFLLQRFSCTAALRQLLPVSLKKGGGGGQGPAPATTRSVRGGTTIRVNAEYCW